MQEQAFWKWLRDDKGLKETVVSSRVSNCRRVERHKGDLDTHWNRDQLEALRDEFEYSKKDQQDGTPPRHGVPINGDPYTGTATLKQAIRLYSEFRTSLDTNGTDSGSPDRELWERYLEDVRRYVESGLLDSQEIEYKLAIERQLQEARRAVLKGDENCLDVVKKAISNNLASTYDKTGLRNWFREHRRKLAKLCEKSGLRTQGCQPQIGSGRSRP